MTPEELHGRELAKQVPELMLQTWEKMPSPVNAALFAGLAGAGLAILLGKNMWKWGLVSGGGGFLASAAVKGSFAAGMMAGSMTMAEACVRNPRKVASMYRDAFLPSQASPVAANVTGYYDPWGG